MEQSMDSKTCDRRRIQTVRSGREGWPVHYVIIKLETNEQTLLPISQLSHLDHTNDQGDYS
jgi:hypothetical protein